MKKKFWTTLLLALVMVLGAAIPVGAKKPLHGHQDLNFNVGFMGDGECAMVTWAGTLDLGGEQYGIAYIPTAPLKQVGQTAHYEEVVHVYAETFDFVGGVFKDCDQPIAMIFEDHGVGNNVTGISQANGKVTWVDEFGPLASFAGRSIKWNGEFGATPLEFAGPFRIN